LTPLADEAPGQSLTIDLSDVQYLRRPDHQ
jgi:hypothetical protein